ncbi:monovalent cation/H+ antiporter complex subunit F [Candidatus Endoriftia persephone]|jgi:multisubunit Na+/H+ antiporter MnhF subunit|uniref:Multiple resistance and pH regulation protein F n=3 Tax=Gammaproteobacteria TaxID=1236 RepID=G2FCS9_9GAMM|nr:monovalent cation/H+ antiporter complex subunit F [Candidatus Endoriftia persephone]EGV50838.1 multiple resistance and pH regulation protein F [endosymbiont of Riftia pachyptila (vent Ph05)]EGW55309.1 multiple resistance and pH regulation protein F [endosymbiont of Tevnia jerichonana (vent Tica)]USF88827.1 monovalent cation/H+ antiporter complex subunit F [Candidatus Endoriftia persephone]
MTLSVLEKLALFLIGAAVVLSFLRLLIGPAAPDRIVAADTLAVITTSALLMLAALFGSVLYLDVALIYGTLAFVGVVAIARAIEGGRP